MEEKQNGNQSLIRGLKLLTLLGNFPNGCPLAKLAELSALNKSTVHRLLQGLQSEGFVQPAGTAGSYRLTTKCLSLGQKTLASMNIINIAAPYLEQVNLNLGETVNFSKREGWHSILIYKLEPTIGMMRTRAYVGQRQQLYCSAMGKLYLAYDRDEISLQYYWQANNANIQQQTCYTITDITKMEIELNEIRQFGFAMDREENELGVCCIAVPVFNHSGQIEYALSVSASIHRLNIDTQENFLQELKKAAQGISKELGYQA